MAKPGSQVREVEEIQIPIPYGFLAAKWWGPKSVRPIICIHGWQDNAGTFDTLIPLLPDHMSYLAIDLPGHGLSSRLPNGMIYGSAQYLYILNYMIKQYFQWNQVSLMGHSMGAGLAFIYASTYPERVDMIITLDRIKPRPFTKQSLKMINPGFEKIMLADQRNQLESEPPAYDYEELIERVNSKTSLSVSRETAPFLLMRGIKPSKLDPNRYYFTRDNRIKVNIYDAYTQEMVIQMASRIECPFLYFESVQSPLPENRKNLDDVANVLKEKKTFEMYQVDGTHHVHLSDPTKLSGKISNFINKYRPLVMMAKL